MVAWGCRIRLLLENLCIHRQIQSAQRAKKNDHEIPYDFQSIVTSTAWFIDAVAYNADDV